MANVDTPNGARYIGNVGGNSKPVIREYTKDAVEASPLFPGDFVALDADGNVRAANAADVILGVCAYVKVDMDVAATEYPGYSPASTESVIGVNIDPMALYVIQTDGTLTAADVGDNAEIVATDGSTSTGVSAHEISSTVAGASAQLRIVAVYGNVENDIASANSKLVVMINESSLLTQAGV